MFHARQWIFLLAAALMAVQPLRAAPAEEKIASVMELYGRADISREAREEIERLTVKALDSVRGKLSGEQLEVLATFARNLVGRNN